MVSMATRKCNMCQFPIENVPFTFQIWKVCTKNLIILRILQHSPQKITLKHFWAYLSLFGHSDAPWWPKPVLKIPREGTFSRVEPQIMNIQNNPHHRGNSTSLVVAYFQFFRNLVEAPEGPMTYKSWCLVSYLH